MAAKQSQQPSQEAVKRRINDAFHDTVQSLKAAKIRVGRMELKGPVLKRKKEAVLAALPQIRSRYGTKYPNLDVDEVWISHCSGMGDSTRLLDYMYHLTLAMALHMLDLLEYHGDRPHRLLQPHREEDPEEEWNLPAFSDSMFEDALIREMLRIIWERNPRREGEGCLLNLAAAKRTAPSVSDDETEEGRIRFQQIYDRIDPVFKKRAINRFQAHCQDFLDILFDCAARYRGQADRLLGQVNRSMAQYERKKATRLIPAQPELPPFAVEELSAQMKSSNEQTKTVMQQNLDSIRRAEQYDDMFDVAVYEFHEAPMGTGVEFVGRVPQEDIDRLSQLEIEDPYEICFGYLCLLESGSPLAWLTNLSGFVLQLAARKLPWTAFAGESDVDDELLEPYEEDDAFEDTEDDAIRIPDEPLDWIRKKSDLYRLDYEDRILYDPMKPPVPNWTINLPQMVYGMTRTLMPRTVHIFDGTAGDLEKAGVDPGYARGIEQYLQLAYDSSFKVHMNCKPSDQDIPEPEAPDPAVMDELQNLKLQIQSLRQELHSREQEQKSLREEADRLAAQEAEERQELAALRELIYLQSNEHDFDEDQANAAPITLPYHNRRKIAVFGGHETWLKAIRPLLPDVVFIPRGQNPNEALIRGQDKIWIQGNALSHSDFYKIINTTRANHIPVRYFGFASARKCARQLAEDDLGDPA